VTDTSSRSDQRRFVSRLYTDPDVLPIISIAGTRGKSTIAWMLTDILMKAGQPMASWLSSGVYVDGELQEGELGPWSRVVLAARHREIDVALQEMAGTTVVGAGLPKATYPIGVMTTLCGNHEACLLNPETQRERRALEVVASAIRSDGVVIANADDYDIAELAVSLPAETVLFALHSENPVLQRHLLEGGVGAWVTENWIVVGDRLTAELVIPVSDIPGTLDGAILFQTQNALAATAVASVLGVEIAHVRSALSEFVPRPDVQPAACNIFAYNDATILVDAPRLVSSLRMLARGVRHIPHRRTIVVSGCFPGLTDDEAVEAGRIIGGLGGVVVLHGENAEEARMDAIKVGIATAPVPPIVLAMSDETRAVDHVLNTIAAADLALIIADNPETVLEHLWPAPVISIDARSRNGGTA
jgi:cyanophycin synthetase